ncbi:NAD(P)/FAD-dependent oxidoreductase [Aquimarina aquimarini]|uniref:NAD(P)/FAD-dependent oxidoreductase n=1 Tax=Aquimarina aquimarini TaxID=1191734 RepID=UPI001F4429F9|nr:FAD-dependent monooxygenase [Aquimarina aquimarini]
MHLHEKEKEEHLVVERDSYKFPIVIVGGGPSGLATSLTLCFRGIKHCIVEARSTPLCKYGEAIPPNAKPLFKQLGIDHLLTSKQHIPYFGNKSCWGNDRLEQKNFISELHGHGYLLNRLFFETQMQDLVKNSEATTFFGYRLKSVRNQTNNLKIKIQKNDKILQIEGEYIIDATGRKASVCSRLGVLKNKLDEQFALVYRMKLSKAIEKQIFIEATSNGWWYVAPTLDNEVVMMFFTIKELLPVKVKTAIFLEQELDTTIHLSKIIKGISFNEKEISIIPANTSCLEKPYGKKWIAVGDAAYSYDPISSYGITSALASGYYAGHALADLFLGKEYSLDVYHYIVGKAFSEYEKKLITHYAIEKRWKNSLYWRKRTEKYLFLENKL